MRAYLQRSIEASLRQLLPDDDADTAISWWIASEGRAPVVVVGAGFTRNARDRVTGLRVAPLHVPLWADVLRRFEEDLGKDLDGLDALTIAELHAEALGPRRHLDVLLEMLPDERLGLGPAHEAIFDLRPAAIVTTNFLDTVLDRHPRAAPIFDDPSAAVRIDPLERTEIIYLHGHRSAPATWVLTRSQYDSLAESKPILMTRVRQLFAQHPILTVGFGLSDPDFHQIQGQIHAQMGGRQPLGLTLLGPRSDKDQTSRRESALRAHWARRNLRLVRFKDRGDFEDSLCKFLRLPGKLELAQCERFLRDERNFRKRIQIARSVLDDADAEKRIEPEYGWQDRLWRACIDAEFSPEELAGIDKRYVAAVQVQPPPRTVGDSSARAEPPRFVTSLLNDEAGYQFWPFAWTCDAWWGSSRDKVGLVDWLHERIVHHDWPADGRSGSDLRLAGLTVLLAQSLPPDSKVDNDPRARDAMRILGRYDPSTASRLGQKFPDLRDSAGPSPADDHHDITRNMAEGFRASMNGERARAVEAYQAAFEAAQRLSDPLALWFAAQSRRMAHDRQRSGSTDDERTRIVRKYRAEESEAERHPKVANWKAAADARVLTLSKLTIEDLQRRARERTFEGFYIRGSDALHLAWRTVRDLEEACAHPHLRWQYLRPLIDHGLGDTAEEASYRLTFDTAERFQEWSRLVAENASYDRKAYDQRSEALIGAWLSLATQQQPSITELLGCIQNVESLAPFVRVDNVDKIGSVLVDAPRALSFGQGDPAFAPDAVKTFRGTEDAASALTRAWTTWLGMRGRPADFVAFKAWADTRRPHELFDGFAGIHGLQWESLVRAGVPVDDVVAWLCAKERLDWLKTAHRGRFVEPFASVLWRLAAVEPRNLSVNAWKTVVEALTALLPTSGASMADAHGLPEGVDAVRAGFGILAAWERQGQKPPAPSALRSLRARLEELVDGYFALGEADRAAVLLLYQLYVAADVLRFDQGIASAQIQRLTKKAIAIWPAVIAFCRLNVSEVGHAATFLAAIVETSSEASSEEVQGKILELLDVSSSALDDLARILHPRYWTTDNWARLVRSMRDAANGARGRFSGTARTSVCNLVRLALLHTGQPLPSDLQFLARAIMDLTLHEHVAVANHAAYTTAKIAECGIPSGDVALANDTAQALHSIASDPRPSVRGAAAYALGYVGNSPHAALRELADALAWLGTDPYAQVQAEWWLGQRRAGDSPKGANGEVVDDGRGQEEAQNSA